MMNKRSWENMMSNVWHVVRYIEMYCMKNRKVCQKSQQVIKKNWNMFTADGAAKLLIQLMFNKAIKQREYTSSVSAGCFYVGNYTDYNSAQRCYSSTLQSNYVSLLI